MIDSSFPTVSDVAHILEVLKKVGFTSAAWWELGLELKLGHERLNTEADYSGSERRLVETIEKCLRSRVDLSWETLANAISQCSSGGPKVAADIRREIGLG